MLKLCNAFSGLKNVRNIIHQGLVRAICFTIAAEYEALLPEPGAWMSFAHMTDKGFAGETWNWSSNVLPRRARQRSRPAWLVYRGAWRQRRI